jgi:tRNA A-37 threonylcarbamoyl transferase component Bud32
MTSDQGVLLHRYRLEHKLGGGGMGSVWLAWDLQLERKVAVKQLVQHAYGEDLDGRRDRALREARAMARVRHPAIVTIHDVLTVEGDPWIVMEYISGSSLDAIIKGVKASGSRLDEQKIAAIGLRVLRGLCAAHEANVVHRDVKPANILVADDKSIFLVDFGIAKIAGDISLTDYRNLVGTTEFLAPERLADKEVGPAADLWSLGVTLYYALEGRSPFRRTSFDATIAAILREEPPPPVRQGRLADVILRLLQKDPAKRANADELGVVLQAVQGTATWPGSPRRPVRPTARPPVRPAPRPAGTRFANVNPADTGAAIEGQGAAEVRVAMLLGVPEDHAAQVLTCYPAGTRSELLQGIAAERPDMAGTILQMFSTADIGPCMSHLRPETAAAILLAMPPDEAARILSRTGARTAGAVIMKLPVEVSAPLIGAMRVQQAAEVLAYVKPATVAALLANTDGDSARLLQALDPPFRAQVTRFSRNHRAEDVRPPDRAR